jgi:anaerobic selenocysteine-containing dehydrogenase
MQSAWPLLIFLAFLFGLALLALICGYASREAERAEEATLARDPLAPRRSFFAVLDEAFQPEPAVDAAVVLGVERHLQSEVLIAQRFVDEPTLARLCDAQPEEPLSISARFELIQEFLEKEIALAREFVCDPTLDRFHGQLTLVSA